MTLGKIGFEMRCVTTVLFVPAICRPLLLSLKDVDVCPFDWCLAKRTLGGQFGAPVRWSVVHLDCHVYSD